MAKKNKPETYQTDIVIAGGGMIGLTTAIGLAGYGFEVMVVEALKPEIQTDPAFDGRASAIASAPRKMLEAIDIWGHVAEFASPIDDIRVSDGPSLLHLHFDHRDVGDEPMGHMLENRFLRRGLLQKEREMEGLTMLAPEKVVDMERQPGKVVLTLESGASIEAQLAIAAEGRGSLLRQIAGIEVEKMDYPQSAIVTSISHEIRHQNIAHERFLPDGPFAILPLRGGQHSSLVWTVRRDMEKVIMDLGPRAFEAEIARRIGDFLGTVKIAGPRWSYPLSLLMADGFVRDRLALVGDSAHGIHPIAGQGLNLGFRDIAALIEVLVEARSVGEDIGAEAVLKRYEQWRRTDTMALVAATDGLNRLFSNDILPVRLARDLGLATVNSIPPLKRYFIRHAMGAFGQLPRLLRGEKIN